MDEQRLERLLDALHRTDGSQSVLRRLCSVCVDAVDVDGAGVSRLDSGRHEVLAASGPVAEVVERLQASSAEGPCVEAVRDGVPSLAPDLETRSSRWPSFAIGALEQGVAAAFAFPLVTAGIPVGALDMYRCDSGELRPDQYDDAIVLADLAALAVVHHRVAVAGAGLEAEPVEPWAYPAVVHHASGMVAEQLTIDVGEALLRLRALGFVSGRSVADVAAQVVDRTLRIESWSDG